ncbi:hypothetical protein, partial [Klebsiella pneumoniae]
VAEQEGQQTETEATGAPQKHHYTLNQQVGSITRSSERTQKLGIFLVLIFIISTQTTPGCATSTR